MNQSDRTKAAEAIKALKTSDSELRQTLQIMGDAIQVGNISGSTGVAIGSGIRQVINQFSLPPEAAVALMDLRVMLGTSLGLDTSHYQMADFILERTRDFVGRQHVFQRVDQFIGSTRSGYFKIEGDPGLGKSAILAEYVRRTLCLAHFNVRALGIVTTAQFLQNICAQLIAEANLPYPSLPAEATRDGAFLLKLLHEAAHKQEPGANIIIAIDALDEVDLATHPAGANILFLPPTLPDGVYFIVTSRQVDVPFNVQAVQVVLDLMSFPAENRKDVETYLRGALDRPAMRNWIDRQGGLTVESFIQIMVKLSESNFMYLRYVLPEIEKGAYKELKIDKLPKGLDGYYHSHWIHMGMTAKPLPRVKIRLVYVLCEARQPVTRGFIAHLARDPTLQIDDVAVQEVLGEWDQFLHEQDTPEGKVYSLYHASFRDFLHRQDIVVAAGESVEGINSVIANNLWEDLFGTEGR
jgi:hypothetical protein